jgi:phosphatidylserine synthase
MVSRMRYYSFKALDLRKRRSYLAIIAIALIIVGIWRFSEPVLLTIAHDLHDFRHHPADYIQASPQSACP